MPNDASEPRRELTILGLLSPYKKQLWFGLLAITGESIAGLLEPWPLKIVLDNIFRGKDMSGWLNRFVQLTTDGSTHGMIVFACIAVLVIAVMDAVCSYAEKYLTTSVGQWVTHDLRRMLYTQVQRLSLSYHDHQPTGDLISRVTSDIDAIQNFIVSGLLGVLVNLVTLLGMIGVMFYINWKFTLIALAVVPVLFTIVYTYTRKVKQASREVRKKEGRLISIVAEVVNSVRVVKAFAREDYEVKRFEGESLETVQAALTARTLKARLVPMVNIITAIGTCAVLWFGAQMVLTGQLSAGSMVVFIFYLGKMYKPMQEISKTMDAYSKAEVGYDRIQEILTSHEEILDIPGARKAPPFRGEIDIEGVDFSYNDEKKILCGVNMHVDAGTMVALVGPTGSGKTTIVNLIARFYEPVHGVVKIDGTDIREFTQKSLRSQISFVLQDTVLFSGTLWDNIAYGRPDATEHEIAEAAEAANAMEFIQKLPNKFNTIVGERGMTLSGGQRQRIAIARAIIRRSPILILDEPTSGLDSASEQLVFDALDRLMEGKTSIVIAHRLATIRKASCIYVVDDGSIVESGSQEDLMSREHGVFRRLHDIQFTEEPLIQESADLI
ncbi:ABC transporter ATP-binding protein [Terriglobus tenax]|uniref:ABC transporter ATP-binding protein n=1 Tax=Terriglobus tenax TaxID=1111115 RepID=UPI0021E03F8B|nr:ABC transporter ATP-binding protein [Terriglobus tenax]